MQNVKRALFSFLPFILIVACALYLFYPVLFPKEGQMLYGMDIYDAYFYWKEFLRKNIFIGQFPFWNPYNFSGVPFLAHPNINILYPANWVFVLLPPEYSFALYFFFHVVFAGISMYLLCRRLTGQWGALFAGSAYAFSGYTAARIYSGHLEYIDTVSWIPLVLLTLYNVFHQPSRNRFIFSVASLTMLFLSGNELFLLMTGELVALYLTVYGIRVIILKQNLKSFLRQSRAVCLSFLLSFGLSALQLLPRFEFLSQSIRATGVPYSIAGSGSLPPEGLRLFLNPYSYGNPFPENFTYTGPWPNLFEFVYYVGVLPVVIIGLSIAAVLTGLALKKKSLARYIPAGGWFLLAVAVLFAYVSLGTYAPFNFHEFLWRYTFLYRGIRFPVRHLFVTMFSLVVASGILVGNIKRKSIQIFLLLILLVDLITFSRGFFRLSGVPTKTINNELVRTLQSGSGLYRVLPDYTVVSPVRRDLDFGAYHLYGLQSTSDYNSMVLSRYYRFIDLMNKSETSSIEKYNVEIPPPDPASGSVDFLNVLYVVTDKSDDKINRLNDSHYTLKSEGERYRVYENTQMLPRFFFVGSAKNYPDDNSVAKALLQGEDLSTQVLLQASKPDNKPPVLDCPPDAKGEVSVISYTPGKIRLEVRAPCSGMLSTSEVYYSGWKATIDRQDVPIYVGNYAFRAIHVPQGIHMIEMEYVPKTYAVGGMVTIVSAAVLIILFKKRWL